MILLIPGHKNHRNGIKKPRRFRNPSMKGVSAESYLKYYSVCIENKDVNSIFGIIIPVTFLFQVDPKFLRNLKYVRKGNMRVAKEKKSEKMES